MQTHNVLQISQFQSRQFCSHWYKPADQLLRLKKEFPGTSFRSIYIDDYLSESKFKEIVISEVLQILAPCGEIIIFEKDKSVLEEVLAISRRISTMGIKLSPQLYSDSGQLSLHLTVLNCKELEASLDVKSEKERGFTFGINTIENRAKALEEVIDSIRSLKLDHYEIIVVGGSKISAWDVRHIGFDEHKNNRAWITRKKNLICHNASYENICIIHDRIMLRHDWFEGMKFWGLSYDVLAFPIFVQQGTKSIRTNWDRVPVDHTMTLENKLWHLNGALDDRDWDKGAYISGTGIIMKKRVWKLCKWNEDLYWGDCEDIELSQRMVNSGLVIRFNPYACATALFPSGVTWENRYEYNSVRLGTFRSNCPILLKFALKFLDIFCLSRKSGLGKQIRLWGKYLYGARTWEQKAVRK